MKVKVLATGDIIDVVKDWDNIGGVVYVGYADKDRNFYQENELELNPDTSEKVIEGWIAVDEAYDGGAYLHTEKPHSELKEFCDTGDYETEWVSKGDVYRIDNKLFPDMTSESEPKRVKLTLTPME